MNTLALELKKIPTWAKDACLVVGSSLLIALFAHVSIPLPFTPVPLATQGGLILLLSVLLGSRRAAAAVVLFLAQGASGLPVFANGAAGFGLLIGPRGGYLVGYLVAAYAVGKIVELFGKRTLVKAFIAMLAGNALLFLFGTAWLSGFVGGVERALLLGVVPFILGDLFKIALGLKILQWIGWTKS